MSVLVNRWYVPYGSVRHARYVTGHGWTTNGKGTLVYFVALWATGKDRFSVTESHLPLWEWRVKNGRSEIMPEGWEPDWSGKWPEGPSMQVGRIAGRIP